MTKPGPTEQLARFAVRTRLDDLGDDVRRAARRSILDTLACAIGGVGERASVAVREHIAEEQSRPVATVWGTDVRASPGHAALANGVAAHALDFDDVSWAMDGHPSAPLLPAVLAVAEARGSTGAEALAAYIVGFEVQARLGHAMARSHYARGWHPTSTMGAVGATAACARLMGLDVPAAQRAIGIAASQLAGTRLNFGTDAKPLHAGLAAQSGVLSAELARRHVTARPDAVEGPMGIADLYSGPSPIELGALGAPYALVDPGVDLKPYPSCRFTHRAIAALLAIRAAAPAGAPAESIACKADPCSRKLLIYDRAATGLEGKFCMAYCLAVTWLDGHPHAESFSDARAARDDVQALAGRITVSDATGPDEVISVQLAGGSHRAERVRHALGSPENPMSSAQLADKAQRCIAPVLGAARAASLAEAVGSIETLAHIRALIALTTPAT